MPSGATVFHEIFTNPPLVSSLQAFRPRQCPGAAISSQPSIAGCRLPRETLWGGGAICGQAAEHPRALMVSPIARLPSACYPVGYDVTRLRLFRNHARSVAARLCLRHFSDG